ncbi:MAG: GNAT family N-acetyltransferase [Lachnospiraceae bacterium]|nr:GNAT family N-acetyltransferase [Lachnospiraceae bacterium]
MIHIKIADNEDIEALMSSRLEMLKVVNDLPEDYEYSDEMIHESRDYFLHGDHLSVLAFDRDEVIGCASMSFIWIMPTFDHPTGKRAHLMNVYTRSEYRRQGIARKMVGLLIEESWNKGVTEISLDSTRSGRPLYQSMGFIDSTECMVLNRTTTCAGSSITNRNQIDLLPK